jgi:hypothetical protein
MHGANEIDLVRPKPIFKAAYDCGTNMSDGHIESLVPNWLPSTGLQ